MASTNPLLIGAMDLDTETAGLTRGSGIYEVGLFDSQTKRALEYQFRPEMVVVDSKIQQDLTKLATATGDLARLEKFGSWRDVAQAHVNIMRGIQDIRQHIQQEELERELKQNFRFLHGAMYGAQSTNQLHLRGGETPEQFAARQRETNPRLGIDLHLAPETTPEEMFRPGSSFREAIKGKTVWLANANFESAQFGAYLKAQEGEGIDHGFKQTLETYNPRNPNPFYVTGVDIHRARVLAQQTGDWTQVWRAYMAAPPVKAGETAVRDIQDVIRAQMSYGKQLGLISTQDGYFGTGMDSAYRIYGSTEDDRAEAELKLRTSEHHRAIEDAAKTQAYVRERSIQFTQAMQHVAEDTPEGRELLAQARQGKGDFYKGALSIQRFKVVAPEVKMVGLANALERAWTDIRDTGSSSQTAGYGGVGQMRLLDPSGKETWVATNQQNRTPYSTMDEVIGHLERERPTEDLGIDIRATWEKVRGEMDASPNPHLVLTSWVDDQKKALADAFEAKESTIMGIANPLEGFSRSPRGVKPILDTLEYAKGARHWGALVGGLTILGGAWKAMGSTPSEPPPSLTSYDYQDWLAYQEQQPGIETRISGMGHQGVGGQSRQHNTDFGSPYRGPWMSNYVLQDQELAREREKVNRERYGVVHFDQQSGLFGALGPFKKFGRTGYSFLSDSQIHSVDAKQYGMRGKLVGLDLTEGNWEVQADDADTVTIQRGGFRARVAGFFGMNKQYSFRLAGIDAPETAHGADSYHTAHPGAEQAKIAFQAMLASKKDLKLVFDPSQSTYGRGLGAVIGDGQNLNFELVKRGAAAYLPFGKRSDSIVSYDALQGMERQASGAHRGIWQQPWAQAYRETAEASGNRITFNTFARKDRLAQSGTKTSMLGLMESAQEQGIYTDEMSREAGLIGRQLKQEKFKPDYSDPMRLDSPPNQAVIQSEGLAQGPASLMRTRGSRTEQNKFSRRGGFGRHDAPMALDSMKSTNSIWQHRRLSSFDNYDTSATMRRERQARMAEKQREVNQTVFNSGIGHHRM